MPHAPSRPVVIRLAKADELAFMGAAYLMTQDAYVELGRLGRGFTVTLWPKNGRSSSGWAKAFRLEYANQLLRWSLSRAGLGLRAETLKRALVLAKAAGGRPQAPQAALTAEQKAEIAALLAEADADTGPRDPLGITRPWTEVRKDR